MKTLNNFFDPISLISEEESEAKIGSWILDPKTSKTFWTKQVFQIYEVPESTPTDVAQGLAQYTPQDRKISG